MITLEKFNFIKDKYQYLSSWAIWAKADHLPKSNVGDLSVLDPIQNKNLLSMLNPNIVLLGLNISRGDIKRPFGNFHDTRPAATDYKIRFAFEGSPFWGGYMTDIIKDFEEKISGKVKTFLRNNRDFELENINLFREELKDIGSENPTLIAFGNETFDIINRHLKDEFKIFKVPHYAHFISKENFREEVKTIW